MKALLLLCLLFPLQEPPKVTVYVIESTRAKTIGRKTFPVYVDESQVCDLDGGRYVALSLPVGEHTFHSKSKKKGGIALDLKAGETYYLRLSVEEGAYFLRDGGISLLPKEEGLYSLKQMKPINMKDVKNPAIVDQSQTERHE